MLSVIRLMFQIQNAWELDPEGGGIPDHQRRAHVGWESEAEPGIVRDHLDGAGVRQAHHGLHQQELCRHGRVPRHHWAPGKSYYANVHSFVSLFLINFLFVSHIVVTMWGAKWDISCFKIGHMHLVNILVVVFLHGMIYVPKYALIVLFRDISSFISSVLLFLCSINK